MAAASLVAACGKSPVSDLAPGELDLLRRHPDEVIEQVGHLTPDAVVQWGVLGRFDWDDRTLEQAGVPFVWSRDARAKLHLPAGPPRDREVAVALWGPCEEGEEREVQVYLNGVALGTSPLPREPAEVRLEAPAAAWKESPYNLLELVVDERRAIEADGQLVGLAVASVDYGPRAEVTCRPESRELTLQPGASVVYQLEELSPMQVALAGRATGSGTLVLTTASLDPETGDEVEELSRSTVELADQRVERGLALASVGGNVLRLRLGWVSDDESSSFSFERLTRIEEQPVERPPIIFVSIDTLAAKHLPMYGYPRDTAPNLARFAEDATVFDYCVTNAPWTVPSYMSVMTGLYPYAHRLPDRERGQASAELWEKWYVAENRWTLAELLRASGYVTAGFADNLWITERFGFPQGFETFDPSAGAIPKIDPEGGIRHVLGLADDWLDEVPQGRPFFLFLHAFDVHGPYAAPEPFRGRFADASLYDADREAPADCLPRTLHSIHDYLLQAPGYEGVHAPARLHTAPFADAYDEGIAMVDAELGHLLADLERRGLYDRSILIVSADHGETMDTEDLLFGHGSLDESVLHVPLIIRFPGGAHAGERVSETVQLADLYPTLMDALGVPAREYLHGRSLLPVVEGTPPARSLPPAYSEGGMMVQRSVVVDGWKLVEKTPGADSSLVFLLSIADLERVWSEEIIPWGEAGDRRIRKMLELIVHSDLDLPAIFARIRREGVHEALYRELLKLPVFKEGFLRILRLYYSTPRYELYDLSRDPKGRVDLSAKEPARVNELRPLLEAATERREHARSLARPPSEPVALSAEAIEALRDVGYVGGED